MLENGLLCVIPRFLQAINDISATLWHIIKVKILTCLTFIRTEPNTFGVKLKITSIKCKSGKLYFYLLFI